MKKRIISYFILIFLVFSITGSGCISSAKGPAPFPEAQGFYISGSRLIDANGHEFIIRGVSHPHCWFTGRTSAITDIKSIGANAVRIVCSNGSRWLPTSASQLSNLIDVCKKNKLIAIPEIHDTTGYGEEEAACSLTGAVSYWEKMQDVLNGQEAYVLINIGNEPYGNKNVENWVQDTKSAVQSMRIAGFNHTLVVDAPNWGQDWSLTMQDNAQSIFDADPDKNTLLSIHMYGVYNTASKVENYIATINGRGLPLLIGEFGHNHSDGDPDEDAIMANAQSFGIGYIGWSWSGNAREVSYLDIVQYWNVKKLTPWGERLINGANGIKATSRECSVYRKIPGRK